MNSSSCASQPVVLSGEKLGAGAVSAPRAGHSAAPAQTRLARTPPMRPRPDVRFNANPDIWPTSLRSGARAAVAAAGARITELRSVGKRDLQELPARVPIAQRMDDHLDLHAGGQGLGNPALADQAGRGAELDRPLHRLSSFAIGDHQQDPAMGIGPLEVLDGAFQGRLLVGIEHGKGMMCHGRDRKHGNREAREAEGFEFHGYLPDWRLQVSLWSSLSREPATDKHFTARGKPQPGNGMPGFPPGERRQGGKTGMETKILRPAPSGNRSFFPSQGMLTCGK